MKSITRKIFLTLCVLVLAAALAAGLALAFTGSGTTFAASASGFDVGDGNYSSFGSAWSAAESGTDEKSQTIVLNENVTLSSAYTVKENENVVLDLNGYSIKISSNSKLVDVYGTFTLKDSTATRGKYTGSSKVGVYSSSNGYMTVYEADDGTGTDTLCKYFYTSGAICGASSSSDNVGVVMAYNGGTFNMDGGSIVSNKYTPSNINSAQSAVVYVDSDSTFNMSGGSISGNTTTDTVTVLLAGSGNLYGGVISGNTTDQTGTVYAESELMVGSNDGTSGPVISGNTARCGGGIAALNDVYMYTGEICCNTTTGTGRMGSGAGVYIMGYDFFMYGGTIHDNNVTSTSYGGGGVFSYGGTSNKNVVELFGGDIYCNYAYENGGGVLAYYVDVVMYDGMKIRKNESRYGAAVYTANVSPYATFTMYGGEISDNKANQSGGASYCYGTTTIYDGLVSGNTAATGGGAFHVRTQPFAIYGGTFTNNSTSGTSTSGGGGVICTADSSSVVTVTGGIFTDNYSAGYGGAMSFYTGSASLSGVTVTDNSAGKCGGGIYIRSNATVSLSGNVYVSSNYVGEARENVFLDSGATVTLSGALGSGSYVGVYIYGSSQTQVTKAESGTSYYLEALRYFHSDVLFDGQYLGYGDSYIELKTGSYVARVDSPSSATSAFYTSLSDALDAARSASASGAGTAVLLKTFTVPSYSGDAWYEVGPSYYLTLDLNGYDIVLDSTNIRAFAVSGNFTLTDSWGEYRYLGTSGTLGATEYSSLGSFETVYRYTDAETGETGYWRYTSGAITGANSYTDDEAHNGVVKVSEGGTFNMLGGTLTGNRSFQGAGVSVYGGTFGMYGGAISYNTGVSVYATGGDVMICGGVITGTSSGYYGSAMRITGSTLYVYESDKALAPIVVSENSDGDYGAVYIQSESYAYIETGNFEFNSAKDGGVLYVRDGSETVVAGGLFAGNTATNSGSAVYVNTATLRMTGGTIYGNTAKGSGATYAAAVFVRYGTFEMTGGEITGNVSTSSNSYGGGVNVSQSAFTMSGGSIYGNVSTYGAGVYVYNGSGTDSIFTMTGGSVYGNTANNGAGVYVDYSSDFEMSGGKIYENSATSSGFSGVFVSNNSTFTMSGGEIYGNHGTWGGGVGVYNSSNFVLAEGSSEETSPSIHDNVGEQYGGGVTVSKSTFTMSGGSIYGNASEDDAGVCAMDSTTTFTMTGGKIYGNTATASYGGGVTVGSGATFDMYGGEIYSNTAATYGGGVAVLGSNTFNMYGGEIHSNTAATYGGGISTNSGSYLTIAGGEIHDNQAFGNGGGVYAAASLTMSGNIIIRDNSSPSGKDNLYLSGSSVFVTLGGEVTEGSYIGLSLYSSTKTQITTAETDTEYYKNSAKYFHLDDDNLAYSSYVGYKTGAFVEILSFAGSAAVVEHADGSYDGAASAEEALRSAVSGDTIILYEDVVWSDCDFGSYVWYEIGSGVELTIDLNGHNIELDSDAYRAFRVYGTLNLTDSSGVYETYMGDLEPGVYQNSDGTFTTIYKMTDEESLETSAYSYTSGAIYGGTNTTNSSQYYGAIYVGERGSLNIYGGTITGNSHCYGGGVYVKGGDTASTGAYFAMYGGSVSGNTTTRHASALYFGYNTDAYIYGGIVTSNTVTATQYGGAVYTYSGVNLYLYEDTDVPTVFSHNSAYYGGALALNTSTVCDIYGGHFEFNSVTNGGAVYTWSDAKLDVRGGYFANNTATDHGGAFYVRGEFNMYGGTVQGNVSTSSTYGAGAILVYNEDGTAVFNMYGGTITNNTSRSHYGGGVAVDYGGIFNMYGGEISKNSAATDGGGIYITSKGGEVHLYGGEVSGNTASYGGGVYIASGTLYVEGGTIDGNSATTTGGGVFSWDAVYIYDGFIGNNTASSQGGGLYLSDGSTLVVDGGYIYDNVAQTGGGLYSKGTVTMTGGFVAYNVAKGDAGGIYAYGKYLEMSGGGVVYNESQSSSWGGGGVVVNYGATFVMTGGEILFNYSKMYGGGVYLGRASTFTMTGGEIRENSADKDAGGVFNESTRLRGTSTDAALSTVELGGKVVIRDNTAGESESDMLYEPGQYTVLLSSLERGSYVGFSMADSSQTQLTTAESGTSFYLSSYTYFHANDGSLTVGYSSAGGYVEIISAEGAAAVVRYRDGSFELASTYEDALDAAKADSESAAGTVVLMRDVYYDDIYGSGNGSVGYGISSGEYLNIDLNGHSIILSSTNERAFTVNGYLSLDDSTGYYSQYSGELSEGVYDNGDGTFTTIYKKSDPETCVTSLCSYTSGAITGSSGTGVGRSYGAIYVSNGKFDMFGGSIVLNSELYGAVCVQGSSSARVATTVFNMYGGSISGNGSDGGLSLGGGVTVGDATFEMYGGIVSDNGSANYGGIYVTNDFVLYIGSPADASDAERVGVTPVISGNTSGGIGGGISVVPYNAVGSVTINGASIEYNTSKTSGGGIYLETTESVTVDAFIGYNEAGTNGGGIFLKSGSVTFTGGKICSNTANSTGYGGAGAYVSSGASFGLTGGIVSQNVTAGYGGGVYLENGSELLVSDAEISFNTAAYMGGGVYALGTLSLSGEAVIRDNTAAGLEGNVLLSANNHIVLAGTLSGDAYIGVSLADSSQTQITSEETTTRRYSTAYRYFFLDVDADKYFVYYSASKYVVIIPFGEVFVIVTDAEGVETYYTTIEDAWTAAISTDPDAMGTITLNADVSPAATLNIDAGEYLALDLGGYTIYAPSSSPAVEVDGYLLMYDSTEVYSLGIEYEGDAAVVDNGDGTFTTYYATIADIDTGEKQWNSYTSGAVTGRVGTGEGTGIYGAIHVGGAGIFDMYGGSVVLNEAGPAIQMTSGNGNPTLRMYGGSVSGNTNTADGASAIDSSNGCIYIYSGIIAANAAEGDNAEIISADGASYLYLGTDDEDILSSLKKSDPDAYEAGVVLSGNYVGKDGLDRLIYMSFSAKTFEMYDRVEISYNCQDADDRGFIQISAGYGYFYGGTIAWNTTGSTYGVIQYVNRAYFYGDFYLGHNSTKEDGHGNLIYDSPIRVDDSFTGTIYVSTVLSSGESLQVTSYAVTDYIYDHVISDREYCKGIDTYLYFYHEHTGEHTYLACENGEFVVYDVCFDCGVLIDSYAVDKIYVTFSDNGAGSVVATYTDPGTAETIAGTMDGGYLVTSGEGENVAYTWYVDISEAIESLGEGDTLALYEDTNLSGSGISIEVNGVTVDLNGHSLVGGVTLSGDDSELDMNGGNVMGDVSVSGDVSLGGGNISGDLTVSGSNSSVDLGGGTVGGGLIVGENSDVTVADSSEDGSGYVGGEIDVPESGRLGIEGGKYADVDGAVDNFSLNEGDVIYIAESSSYASMVSSDDIESVSAEASVTTADGKTYYFASLADAVEFVNKNAGGKITVEADVSCDGTLEILAAVEIDLNGHTLSADFAIDAGGGYDDSDPVSLTIEDSSVDAAGESLGTLSGTITVTGYNATDTEVSGSSYEKTLSISAAVKGNYSVDLTGLVGTGATYGLTDGADGSYSITTGHEHDFEENITKEFSYNSDGTVTYIVRCACGEIQTYTEKDSGGTVGDIYVHEGCIVGYTYSSMMGVTLYVASEDTSDGTYEDVIMLDPVAMVQYGDGEGNIVTVFFETFEKAATFADCLLSGEVGSAGSATLVLMRNATDADIEVSSGDLTINLNGYNLSGNVTVAEGATVTVTSESATVYNYNVGGDATEASVQAGKNGNIDVTVSDFSEGDFSITGGYILEENLGYLESFIAEGYVAIYENGKYAVISTEEAEERAVAYTLGSDGNATYYLSLQDAFDAAEDGDTVYLVKDLSCDDEAGAGVFGKNMTLDLNGHTLETDINVESGSSVTMRDTSDGGTGLYTGTLSGSGEITVESGSYTSDVSEYLAPNKALYATCLCDEDTGTGTVVYTVIDKYGSDEAKDAEASITRTDGKGNAYTVYYDDMETALADIRDGDTLTLLNDISDKGEDFVLGFASVDGTETSVTLDLNGFTVDCGIHVGDGCLLTIVDSSAGMTGGVSGSYDPGSGAVTGDIFVDEGGCLTTEGGTYSGDVSEYVDVDGQYAVFVSENESGETLYTVMSERETQKDAKASVAYTGEDGTERTIYFDDALSAMEWASEISSENGVSGVTVTLYDDIDSESGITIDGGNLTVDLNGHDIGSDVTVENGGSLTIEGVGCVSGTVTAEDGTFVADGGTYTQDVGDYVADGKAILVDSERKYEVVSEDEAKGRAAASVTIAVNGEEETIYFESIEDALEYIGETQAADMEANDGKLSSDYTLTLWDDVEESDIAEGDDGKKTLTLDGDFSFDMNGYDVDVDIVIAGGSDIDMDLGGGTVKGGITVGETDETGSASLTITDSSTDEAAGTAGTGSVNGGITSQNDHNEISLEGGTYGGNADIDDYIPETSERVTGSDGSTTVVPSEEIAKSISGAYVEKYDEDGNLIDTVYYESAEDAVGAAAADGGKVVLLEDASVTDVTIYGDVEIDLNGHSLNIEATVMADETYEGDTSSGAGEGGSLKITDSSAYEEDGDTPKTDGGTGSITGSVTVKGSTDAVSNDDNSYADALVFESGAEPGTGLNITLDIESGNSSSGDVGAAYVFGDIVDDEGETTGKYGIYVDDSHTEHSYVLPVWSVDENGNVTLTLKCSCGAEDEGHVYTIGADELTVTPSADGSTYIVTGTAKDEDGVVVCDENGEPYTYTETRVTVATVTVGDDTYYFDSLQGATDFVAESGRGDLVIVLHTDATGDVDVESGNVEIDLGGFDLGGTVTVGGSAELTIADSSEDGSGSVSGNMEVSGTLNLGGGTYDGTIDVKSDGSLNVSDGAVVNSDMTMEDGAAFSTGNGEYAYTEGNFEAVTGALANTEDSLFAYVTDEGMIIVTDDAAAASDARVKTVKADGTEIYYDSLEEACKNLEDGDTLVLLDAVSSDESVDVAGVSGVTIDLNGNEILGSLRVSGGAGVTVTGDGYVESVFVEEDSSLALRGGTYNAWSIVSTYTDYENGYVIYVNDGYTFTVTTPENAESTAEAKTSSHDDSYRSDIYFENLQDAVDYAVSKEGSVTGTTPEVTLVGDTDGGVRVTGDVVIDLSGNDLGGDVYVEGGSEFTLADSSEDCSGTVSGQIYAESGVEGEPGGAADDTVVNVEGGTVRDGVYAGDYAEVNVSGGSVDGNVETGGNSTVTVENGGVVSGGVKTGDNSSVIVDEGEVSGSIYCGDDNDIDISGSTVGGGIYGGDGTDISVSGSDVGGDISTGSHSSVEVTENDDGEGTRVGGDVSTGTGSDVTISGSDVEGNISTGNGRDEDEADGSSVRVEDSTIGGDITTSDGFSDEEKGARSSVEVSDSTVGGGISTGDYSDVSVSGSDIGDADGTEKGGITTGDNSSVEVKENDDGERSSVAGDIATGTNSDVTVSGSDVEGDISTGNGADDEETDDSSVTVESGSHVGGGITVGGGTSPDDDGKRTSSVDVSESIVDGGISTGGNTDVTVSNGAVVNGGIETGDGSGINISDNEGDGTTVNGGVTLGGGSEFEVSGGSVNGDVTLGEDTSSDVTGGTFEDESILDSLGEGYVGVVTGGGNREIMSEDDAKVSADAYVETEYVDETTGETVTEKTYYENIEDAIAAAEESGGKVILNHDVSCGETIDIYGPVEIDTNGYTLDADIVIHADKDTDEDGKIGEGEYGAGGSLTVSDSSAYGEEDTKKTEGGTGSISGSITVEGDGDATSGDNPYDKTLIFTDGVTPGADLDVDMSGLGPDGTEYVLEYDETTGDFVISTGTGHEHTYNIAVWEFNENGDMTLKFMCACGEYEVDENGDGVVYEAEVSEVVYDQDTNTIKYTYTVELEDGATYTKDVVYDCQASVSVTDSEGNATQHYFEDLQDAIDFALENGGTVVLESDYEGDLVLGEGAEVEMDLAGHTFEGSITVPAGSMLTFTDTSSEGGDEGEVIISGGDVDGTLVLDGVDVTLTDDLDASEGSLKIDGDVTVNLGNNTLTAAPEISSGSSLTVEGDRGSEFVLSADTAISGGASLTIGGSTDFDLGGNGLTIEDEDENDVSKGGTFTLTDDASVNFGGGKIDGEITVSENSDVTIDVGSGALNGKVSGDGNVTEYVSEGGSVTGDTSVGGDASIYVDGGTYEGDVTSETGDVLVNVTGGGSFEGDIAAKGGNIEVFVDGAGSTIDGNISSFGDAEITVTEGGTIKTADEEGAGISVGGNADVNVKGGTMESDIYVVGNADIDVTGGGKISGDATFSGDADVYVGSGSEIGGDMDFEGESVLDIAGGAVVSDVTVGSAGSLTVEDTSSRKSGSMDGSTITVTEGGSLVMTDGTFEAFADGDGTLSMNPEVSIVTSCGKKSTDYVFVAAAEEDGTIYYETQTAENHKESGHGYDVYKECSFCPETATLKITYICLCGDTIDCELVLEYGVNYTTSYEMTSDDDGGDCAVVTVDFSVAEYVEAPNGVVYPVIASGTCEIGDMLYFAGADTTENDYNSDDDYKFTFERTQTADCYQGGVDTYTYGDDGIIVVVTSGAVHGGISLVGTLEDGTKIYYCEDCERYYVGRSSESYENGYTEAGLGREIGNYEDFEKTVEAAKSDLNDLFESLGISDEDKYGAGNALRGAIEALDALEYEFLGDGSSVYDELTDAIREIFDEAELAMINAALAESAEEKIVSAYEEIIASIGEDQVGAVREELEAILSDLAYVRAESTSDEDISVFETFVESAMRDLLSSFTTTSVSSPEASAGGYRAGITVTDGDGFIGTVEVVIEDVEDEEFYAWVIANSSLVYYKGGEESDEYTGGALEALVYGKGVVAVFDIYLRDSFSDVKVYVFSGVYLVSIELPDDVKGVENLQVVYVGDDGRVEVYETSVEDGVLYFTTTHFSEFVLLGDARTEYMVGKTSTSAKTDGGEKETDLTAAIIALAVVDGVLLILGIVLLVILLFRKGAIGGKKSAASFGIFALLAIVPAGGLAITIVLGVLALAFAGADVYLIYAIFTTQPLDGIPEGGNAGAESENAAGANGGETAPTDAEDGAVNKKD